jgi:hypothetical protein
MLEKQNNANSEKIRALQESGRRGRDRHSTEGF